MAKVHQARVAWSSDPLDNRQDIGPNNEFMELLEELQDADDPLVIIIRCEQTDQKEGRAIGTTLQMYFESLTNTSTKGST